MSSEKFDLNAKLSPEAVEYLEELAEALNASVSEVLERMVILHAASLMHAVASDSLEEVAATPSCSC